MKPKLHNILTMRTEEFSKYGDSLETPDGLLVFRDNNQPILGVCHLDAVGFMEPRVQGDVINCMQLDDRLGVWALLAHKRFKCDILLTDSEELGRSTARHFKPPRQYNWVFGLDRAGMDAVTYDYGDDDWDDVVAQHYQLGLGSFSDISCLEHLGCKGVNLGIGYVDQHTKTCRANLKTTAKLIDRAISFCCEHRNTPWPHVYTPWEEHFSSGREYEEELVCNYCHEPLEDYWYFCPMCGADISMQSTRTYCTKEMPHWED